MKESSGGKYEGSETPPAFGESFDEDGELIDYAEFY